MNKLFKQPHLVTPSPDRRGGIQILAALCAAMLLSACATQDDGDVLFSDTEKAIIKTLVYTDPPDDPTSNYDQNSAAATLGQKFFMDVRFSGEILIQGNRTNTYAAGGSTSEGKIACVSCHSPNFGWADGTTRPNDVSLGTNFTDRNSPTILNSVFNTYSLWDGSADSPWSLIRAPIEGPPQNFGRLGVAKVICGNATYQTEYDSVFDSSTGMGAGSFTTTLCNAINTAYAACSTTNYSREYGKPGQTCYDTTLNATLAGSKTEVDKIFANFAKAIAAYERKIVSKNSAFDQWAAGNENAMSVAQKRGLKVFINKGNCVRCHSGPNFSDGKFHNLGVPQVLLVGSTYDEGRNTGITKLLNTTTSNGYFNTASVYNDGSTNRVSGLAAASSDVGAFKTPTLRSVSKTAPYFHNGSVESLWDVVNFYNFAGNGGNFPGTKDTILTTRKMTNEEMEDLVNFLRALDGEAIDSTLTANTAP